MNTSGAGARRGTAAVAIAFGFALSWFALLGVRPLFNPDEGRYAEIPREMAATGDWATAKSIGGRNGRRRRPLQHGEVPAESANRVGKRALGPRPQPRNEEYAPDYC